VSPSQEAENPAESDSKFGTSIQPEEKAKWLSDHSSIKSIPDPK
jgi:hypothetical protein